MPPKKPLITFIKVFTGFGVIVEGGRALGEYNQKSKQHALGVEKFHFD